jgi:hypothetical protein
MIKYGVTAVDKIEQVLKNNESGIELKTIDNKLFIRNSDWENLRTVR